MCIRDSPTSTDTLVGRATTDTLTNKTLTAPVISTISNTGTLTLPTSTDTFAFSYTHLRAHETKANLVCRLLLEKKKKNITHNHTNNHIYQTTHHTTEKTTHT